MYDTDPSAKTVADAQNTTSDDSESVRGAIYGEASDEQIEQFREFDRVQYPDAERETELDTSIDGAPSDELAQKRAEQGRLDRGTDEAVNGSWGGFGADSEFDNKTLHAQERIEGREAELEKISKRAGANPEEYPRQAEKQARERMQMDLHQDRMEESRAAVAEQAASGVVSRGYVDDPREHLDNETVGEIYKQSKRLDERFGSSRSAIARRLATKVADGVGMTEAVMSVVEDLCEDRSVISDIDMVDPTDSWATIEGVVAKLFDPASNNQQQVAVVEDESSSVKTTIWRNSRQDVVLNEGDVVELHDAKPGAYKGQLTLAVTSDTEIWVREKGDGPAIANFGYEANGGQTQDRCKDVSPWMNGESVPRPEHDRRNHREWMMFVNASDAPEGYEERENVESLEDEDGETVAFAVAVRERFENFGVSWGEQQRKEAKENGRQRRVQERKYNIPDWKKTTSVIDAYRHQDLTPFGADQRMIEIDLPPLRNRE